MTFDVDAIMSKCSRSQFPPCPGELEKQSLSLIEAASTGDLDTVYQILRTGRVDCNVCDDHGNFALLGAAINCHTEIVNLLLDAGANVNQVCLKTLKIHLRAS